MGDTVKQNTAVAVEVESTEGTYESVSGASSFIQTLADGFEMTPTKELIERNIYNGSIGMTTPRTGTKSVTGTLPVEARAGAAAGDAPEFDALMQSALGTKRQITSVVTTKASGNTSSTLEIEDADIGDFNVGDIVMVKESGAYHVSPITAVDTTSSAAQITLLVSHPDGAMSNSVEIEKVTNYTVADSGHPSLSISKWVESEVLEKGIGCKVNNLSLENFTTGQIPSFSFGFEGLNFDRVLSTNGNTPSYDSTLPPIILDAHLYQDGTELTVNELSFSLENALGFKTAISESNGRKSSRATQRSITGSFNPYKQDDDISNFTKFDNNTEFSLFAYAMVPTGTAGEFGNVVAVYLPNCIITEMGEADQDGLLQDSISFSASRGSSGTDKEIYVAFI